MRIRFRALIIICTLVLLSAPAFAYKEVVHQKISRHAFARLTVDFAARLGLDTSKPIIGRIVADWLAKGAFDQDQYFRPLNHFFDPQHLAPLTLRYPAQNLPCLPVGLRADFWATTDLNGNSVPNAKLAYRDALKAPNPGSRKTFERDLFITLGHVIHLIQDMAQPEHTRNDQHLPRSQRLLRNGTEASLYEEWGLQNLLDDPTASPPRSAAVDYDSYPVVTFSNYRDFFHTESGHGLADFANRNFVTQDTNYSDTFFRCFYYDEPKIDMARPRDLIGVSERILVGGKYQTVVVDERIYTSLPEDRRVNVTEIDVFHTVYSALDLETRKMGSPTYSLSDGSYLSRASMLIPRAVGYSAGLIEHVFRGKLDTGWTKQPDGNYELKITNRSAETLGDDAWLTVLYRAKPTYLDRTTEDDTVILTAGMLDMLVPGFTELAPGQTVTIPDLVPKLIKPGDSLLAFERRVVIEGTLGDESNAVMAKVDMVPEPIDELKVEVSWTNGFAPQFFIRPDPTPIPLNYIAQFEAIGPKVLHIWPDSTLVGGPAGPSPLLPFHGKISSSPILFQTTNVPVLKKLLLQAWMDKSFAYTVADNFTVKIWVDGKLEKIEVCPEPNLATKMCRYNLFCGNGQCTIINAPF